MSSSSSCPRSATRSPPARRRQWSKSVKAASDVYAPLSGEVVKVNEALVDEPGLVNSAAEAAGWFFQLRISDPRELGELMDAAAYQGFVATL